MKLALCWLPNRAIFAMQRIVIAYCYTREIISNAVTGSGITAKKPMINARAIKDALTTNTNLLCIATDQAGVIQFFNRGAEQLLGFEADHVVGKLNMLDVSAPQENSSFADPLTATPVSPVSPATPVAPVTPVMPVTREVQASRRWSTAPTSGYELNLLRKDGRPIPVFATVSVTHDAQGTVSGYVFVGWAYDEQKRLYTSEERFRRLFESAQDGILILDAVTGIVIDANPFLLSLLGYTIAEIKAKYIWDLGFFKNIADNKANFLELQRQKYIRYADLPLETAHGKVVNVEFVSNVYLEGSIEVIQCNIRDNTARKVAEENILKLSQVVDQSPDGIVISNVLGEIEYVNHAFVMETGYSVEEVIGKNPRFLQSGKTAPETYKALWAALTSGRTWKGEFLNRRKDGTEYTEFDIIAPLRAGDGTISHYVALKEDATQRKQLTEELQAHRLHLQELVGIRTAELAEAKNVAESANHAKSTFLATISHEIRTPLNGILGMIELLTLSDLDDDQRAKLDVVSQSGQSLLRIISDILDYSKIEAGKLEIINEIASVSRIVGNSCNLYRASASRKGLTLKSDIDPQISPHVWADPQRLQQILNNLVSNAIKFTNEGQIAIHAKLVKKRPNLELIEISVIDGGIGVSADQMKFLFEPFTQIDTNSTRRYSGTGLGLSICRRLAEMMGGSISMESKLGVGTTVRLIVALAPAAAIEALPPQVTDDRTNRANDLRVLIARDLASNALSAPADGTLVLVVDDHPANRLVLVHQLKALGYAAETAENGLDGLEKWKTGRYDLVIVDCQMPILDGYEMVTQLRAIELATGCARTPVIACTANAMIGEADKCKAVGMDDFLTKPLEITDVAQKLNLWLPLRANKPPLGGDTAHHAAVDTNTLAAIFRGSATTKAELIRIFRDANDQDASDLRFAITARDIVATMRTAHRIKGAAGLIGATRLASLAKQIEQECGEANWQAIAEMLQQFERELGQVNAFLDSA
jgi:PAS domain S-box-containing protein